MVEGSAQGVWVDERCVPHSDAESNYGGARAWLAKTTIPASSIIAISEQAEDKATDYEKRLKALPESTLPRDRIHCLRGPCSTPHRYRASTERCSARPVR